ncbi:MAG: excinuclease ABC subunit UvrA [Candidatus Sumerlaeaceae bacterium]
MSTAAIDTIVIRGACEHNLKNVSLTIPRDSLTVVTGLSGSGKSSLAFDTIYAEGQRRYMESLSAYARQYLDQMHKPKVEFVEGLSPSISIEQKTVSKNPRSTVGTVTEIYDYLRVLYANVGRPHCPQCGRQITKQTVAQIVDSILGWPTGTKILVMAPIVRGRKGEYRQEFDDARRQGYVRARVDGEIIELENAPKLKKSFKHEISIVIDRMIVRQDARGRLLDSLTTALGKADGLAEVQTVDDNKVHLFSEHFACPECGTQVEEITPRLFSFNSPYGACPKCKGIGTLMEVDGDLVVPDRTLSVKDGALAPWADAIHESGGKARNPWQSQIVHALAKHFKIDLEKPFAKLTAEHQKILLHGSREKFEVIQVSARGNKTKSMMTWEGMVPRVLRRYTEDEAMELERFFRDMPCPDCAGLRLRPASLAVKIGGLNIGEFCGFAVDAALRFLSELQLSKRELAIGGQILKEIRERLEFLCKVGLHYITLDRKSATISGGEGQRIRLATQIGSLLTGVLYVLDEPSIGLHQRDNEKLIDALKHLRDLGNTVIVVEHDEHTIRSADYVVDLGPGAGAHGGHIVSYGSPAHIINCPQSITGRFLRGDEKIAVPAERRKPDAKRQLVVRGACEHNLKNLDAAFPLGLFICVTGVSGSGKSTLVNDILYNSLSQFVYDAGTRPGAHTRIDGLDLIDKVVDVDQSPIGRTPRSNPATYTGVFTAIRDLFAQLPEAQIRGYGPGRFSFNVKGGRCEECTGDGMCKIEMHFLPDVYVECQVCRGRRFNRETLEVTFKGKSIADVLEMTIDEACEFFSAQPSICHKMRTLRDVGLGYLTLGQSATTLSGGEAQRVKLAKELSKRATGRTVYILDEPTTGLHFEDIRKLLGVLQALVSTGNTVIVIEHNLDVIKTADYIMDLGPEGGETGGYIVATGTPEQVATNERSVTGLFIKHALLASGVSPPTNITVRKTRNIA